jgi:hypothetical protein
MRVLTDDDQLTRGDRVADGVRRVTDIHPRFRFGRVLNT